MRKWIFWLTLCAILCYPSTVQASPMDVPVSAAILIEAATGQVAYEENADITMPVASVVKTMPILLALEMLETGRAALSDRITASPRAQSMGGSQALIEAGGVYTLSDLLKSMIVASANDATVAVCEYLFGSEQAAVVRMNRRAQELGMKNTAYKNATGLPVEGQYTSARDVATVCREIVKKPQFFTFSTIWMDELKHPNGRVTQLTNTNKLIRLMPGVDGLKTGSTNEAGYCIAATMQQNNARWIAVVLGANSGSQRFAAAGELLSYGFAGFMTCDVCKEGDIVAPQVTVRSGKPAAVDIVLPEGRQVLVPRGGGDIKLVPEVPSILSAPIKAGEVVGKVRVFVDGVEVEPIDAIAAQGSDTASFVGNVSDIYMKWFYR